MLTNDYIIDLVEEVAQKMQTLSYALKAQKHKQEPMTGSCVIRVLEPEQLNDFTGGGTQGGDTMPPRYSDGSLRQRKSGIYEYRFMLEDKQISVYGDDPETCYAKRTGFIAGNKKKQQTEKKSTEKPRTLESWITQWFETYKKPRNGAESQKTTLYFINRDIIPKLGARPIKDMSGLEIQAFINGYENTKNAQKKIFDILNGALEKLVDLNMLKYNPCRAVEIRSYEKQHYPVIQPADQDRLLNASENPKYNALFRFCCCTGLRIGEALNVKTEHVDRERFLIRVVKKATKTKGSSRAIPYLPELLTGIDLSQEYLFQGVTYNSAKTYFEKWYKRLKIDATLHSTRHTFISCCYHIGIRDKQIQLWAGHASIDMTLNTYTHILDNQDSSILQYLRALKAKLGI